jgi:hypothetical protein
MHFAWPPINFKWVAHPHNALMQWLAEWGIPATGIMGGFTIWGGWRWMQQEKESLENMDDGSHHVAVALVASALAGAAHAMVSGLIVMPVSQVLVALIGGWAWGRYHHEDSVSETQFSTGAHAVLCVVLLASVAVVGSSLQDLSTIEERRSAFVDTADRTYFSPRYWAQGYIGLQDASVRDRARPDQ